MSIQESEKLYAYYTSRLDNLRNLPNDYFVRKEISSLRTVAAKKFFSFAKDAAVQFLEKHTADYAGLALMHANKGVEFRKTPDLLILQAEFYQKHAALRHSTLVDVSKEHALAERKLLTAPPESVNQAFYRAELFREMGSSSLMYDELSFIQNTVTLPEEAILCSRLLWAAGDKGEALDFLVTTFQKDRFCEDYRMAKEIITCSLALNDMQFASSYYVQKEGLEKYASSFVEPHTTYSKILSKWDRNRYHWTMLSELL